MQIDINKILENALNIYHYGSFVYGTFTEGTSDYDYIVILPNRYTEMDKEQYMEANCQYSFYVQSTWQTMLDDNEVCAIETYFLPKKYIVKETIKFTTTIIPDKIRENFSHVASNSYVKCKKKLVVADSFAPRIAKKSLWHSLRIIDFGIQILKSGAILSYCSMNHLYDEIVLCESNDWEYYKNKYKPFYNSIKTEFRLCAPKV